MIKNQSYRHFPGVTIHLRRWFGVTGVFLNFLGDEVGEECALKGELISFSASLLRTLFEPTSICSCKNTYI